MQQVSPSFYTKIVFLLLLMATPLLLQKKDVELVKPADSTPSEVLSLSTLDNDEAFEFLHPTVHVYQGNNITNLDPSLVIKEALSKVLVYYYPLAGKLKREKDNKLRITCNADGVPFQEAYADCELSSLHYLDGIDSETAKQLLFEWPSESEFGYHPLVLRVTKFSCGGFTITMGMSHSICDGSGAAQFYKALTELASGKSEPTINPVWERERLLGTARKDAILSPIDMSSLAKSPFWPCTAVARESFYVTEDAIRRLKMSLLRELGKKETDNFTTFEILGAYVWRSRSRALQLSSDGKTMFCMVVGIRDVLNPPLNVGYYGNAILNSSPVILTARELDKLPLSKVAKMIKESKKVVTSSTDYIQKVLDSEETMLQNFVQLEMGQGISYLELTDWRNIGFLENVDFGWKEMVNMITLPLEWDNSSIYLYDILPPCKGKGGVKVYVTLPDAAMTKMKQEMKILNQYEGDHIHIRSAL